MLIVVRHASPAASPDVPPAEWELTDAGRRAAADLMATVPGDAVLVSSTEPKAWQTLGGTGAVLRDDRFCEVARPIEPWSDDFQRVRAAYVSGTRHDGWEPRTEVAARFQAGVAEHTPADGAALVVGTHGMAFTSWLVVSGVLADGEAEAFWRDLRFPDAHVVDLESRTVRRYNGSA